MRKVGTFGFGNKINDNEEYYKRHNNINLFYTDKDGKKAVGFDDMESWAVTLNSPWSITHEYYKIEINCKNAYTAMDENEPFWRCIYTVIGYDGISAEVIGYGNTEEEALRDCKELFKYIQKNFNKDDESF